MMIINPPPADTAVYDLLMEILDYCCAPSSAAKRSFNDRAVSRLLAVNPRTLTKMREEGDDWPWWNIVFREAVSHILPHLPRWKRIEVAKMLRRLPEEMAEKIESACAAHDYIFEMLKDGPVTARTMKATANRGDISEYAVKKAAKEIGVTKTRQGKGKAQRTYWALPNYDPAS